jgi:hypothetical protein
MKFQSIAQSSLVVLSALLAPLHSFASAGPAPYCVAVNGGFGSTDGGTTFVARNFTFPDASKCSPWSGYTKTGATVILTTGGTVCLSSDSKALTVSLSSADPDYFGGGGALGVDYIKLARDSATDPFSGYDSGYFTGTAAPVSCTNDLLTLPSSHD